MKSCRSFTYPAHKSLCLLGRRFSSQPSFFEVLLTCRQCLSKSSEAEKGHLTPSDRSNVGVGVCEYLCGMVITRLIKNRVKMDKDS